MDSDMFEREDGMHGDVEAFMWAYEQGLAAQEWDRKYPDSVEFLEWLGNSRYLSQGANNV